MVDVDRPDRKARRVHGKSDPVDAYAAATAVLSGRAHGRPKTRDGIVEAIRSLRVVHRSAIKSRTQTINQIRTLIVSAPAGVRERLRGLPTHPVDAQLARSRPGADLANPTCAVRTALRRLARRYQHLTEEIAETDAELDPLVAQAAPGLVDLTGVGTETAAQLLITAGDNPDRLKSEASSPTCAGRPPSPPVPAGPTATASTAAVTARPTMPSTRSPSCGCATTPAPGSTSRDALPKACPRRTSSAASNASSRERSTSI